MIYCTRFLEISGRGEKNESERRNGKNENLKRDAKSSTVIASPLLYGCHVFKGQLITTCHHTAWNNSRGVFCFFLIFYHIRQSIGGPASGLSAVVVDYRLEGESLVDNDSHCSFGWGVEAWEMTHREE